VVSVSVRTLGMTYQVPVKKEGLKAAIHSLFKREYRSIDAVHEVDFDVEAGEVVGFIGPNGAGKTTTLKILSGILHPTHGTAKVLGYIPWRREHQFLRNIAMIRGSQPIGGPAELTVLDSFNFQKLIYEIPENNYRKNLAQLTEMLDLQSLLNRQVRALSLGERMRSGLALSLLYRPRVLFLDEPTIGLDATAVRMVRDFISAYSKETKATILLTSHYMTDVEVLCPRIILIDDGQLRYDGDLRKLTKNLSPYQELTLTLKDNTQFDWCYNGKAVSSVNGKVSLKILRDEVPRITAELLARVAIHDLSIQEMPLENVIDQIYRAGKA